MKNAVAICCYRPQAFVRAHCWALQNGFTSVLAARADLSGLTEIQAEMGDFSAITDDISPTMISGLQTIHVDALPMPASLPAAQWPEPVALLFTSGSTGRAVRVSRSAASIRGEVECLRALLPSAIAGATFITTVPLEHMFGYTFGFWLPQLVGARLLAERIVLPQDLRNACASAVAPLWIITTPLHLRAYCELGAAFPNVAGILCATAPLPARLAQRACELFGAPVTEIYGSTETGAIASRLWQASGTAPCWQALAGIRIQKDHAGHAVCEAGHLGAAITLPDQIEFDSDGFHITGRATDIVKVAGKRHSLCTLNELLISVPGVRDGVFFSPSSIHANATDSDRLAAFVVPAPGCTRQQVLQALRQSVDEVFLPRPLYLVERLPRMSTGKLRQQDLAALWKNCRAGQSPYAIVI